MGNYSLPTKQKRFEEMQSTLEGYEQRELALREKIKGLVEALESLVNCIVNAKHEDLHAALMRAREALRSSGVRNE